MGKFQWICLEWYTLHQHHLYYWFAVCSLYIFCEISIDNQHVSRYLSWLIYEIIVKSDIPKQFSLKSNRYTENRNICELYSHKPLSRWVKLLILVFVELILFSIDLWKFAVFEIIIDYISRAGLSFLRTAIIWLMFSHIYADFHIIYFIVFYFNIM